MKKLKKAMMAYEKKIRRTGSFLESLDELVNARKEKDRIFRQYPNWRDIIKQVDKEIREELL